MTSYLVTEAYKAVQRAERAVSLACRLRFASKIAIAAALVRKAEKDFSEVKAISVLRAPDSRDLKSMIRSSSLTARRISTRVHMLKGSKFQELRQAARKLEITLLKKKKETPR